MLCTCKFVLENLHELPLTDAVSVDDDSVRLVTSSGLVEHHQMLLHHGRQFLDDLRSVSLHPNRGGVPKSRAAVAS